MAEVKGRSFFPEGAFNENSSGNPMEDHDDVVVGNSSDEATPVLEVMISKNTSNFTAAAAAASSIPISIEMGRRLNDNEVEARRGRRQIIVQEEILREFVTRIAEESREDDGDHQELGWSMGAEMSVAQGHAQGNMPSLEDVRRSVVESRAAAWEDAEHAKYTAR